MLCRPAGLGPLGGTSFLLTYGAGQGYISTVVCCFGRCYGYAKKGLWLILLWVPSGAGRCLRQRG